MARGLQLQPGIAWRRGSANNCLKKVGRSVTLSRRKVLALGTLLLGASLFLPLIESAVSAQQGGGIDPVFQSLNPRNQAFLYPK